MAPLAELRGGQIAYLEELEEGETATTPLEGFGTSPSDYDIRVENAGAGAGVRITADRPLARVLFWSIRAPSPLPAPSRISKDTSSRAKNSPGESLTISTRLDKIDVAEAFLALRRFRFSWPLHGQRILADQPAPHGWSGRAKTFYPMGQLFGHRTRVTSRIPRIRVFPGI